MSAAAMMSRLCSHEQASCSVSNVGQCAPPLPHAAQASRRLLKWQSHSRTAGYCHIASGHDKLALKHDSRFRRTHQRTCSSASTEAYATVSGLQADLAAAVSAEDYQRAASLRDELM
ncbi:hypothetical protein ABBQ32_004222 [Trebouxia sp. C0010 RCD-2024]